MGNFGFPKKNSALPQPPIQKCGSFTQHMRNQAAGRCCRMVLAGFTSPTQPCAPWIIYDIAI
jgi:hypothetical protein